MTDALTRLADAVEAGTLKPVDLVMLKPNEHAQAWEAYHGSLDAAKSLHEAVLPDWGANIGTDGFSKVYRGGSVVTVMQCARIDGKPARAWLLAILRALAQVQQ